MDEPTELLAARTLLVSVTQRWRRQHLQGSVLDAAEAVLASLETVLSEGLYHASAGALAHLQTQLDYLLEAVDRIRELGKGDSLTAASAELVKQIDTMLAHRGRPA